jgi:hypothetical protein
MVTPQQLAFRPTNVIHQLGSESRIPLFSGRHVLQSIANKEIVLWVPHVSNTKMIPAILRAAAHLKSVIGFSLSPASVEQHDLRGEGLPQNLFRAVVGAAKEIDQVPPFLLHVQEPPIDKPQGPKYEAVRDHIFRCLDAGFTSFGIDLSECLPQDCIAVAKGLLEPVIDIELGIMLRLPAWGTNVFEQASNTIALVGALKKEGVYPDLVCLPGPEELGKAWTLASNVGPKVASGAIAWNDNMKEHPLDKMTQSVVRALINGTRLDGLFDRQKMEQMDTDRLEAIIYMEALEIISHLGGKDSSANMTDVLKMS